MEDEKTAIVSELAEYLYESERRLDPGTMEDAWCDVDDFTRAFYTECIWGLLTRKSLLARFFKLSDCNVWNR